MVTNSDLKIKLLDKKYPQDIKSLIKRFRREYPTNINYIRRLDKEYKIIKEKGNEDSEHRIFYVGATRARKTLHIVEPKDKNGYEI